MTAQYKTISNINYKFENGSLYVETGNAWLHVLSTHRSNDINEILDEYLNTY